MMQSNLNTTDRDELRKKLRAKIRSKKQGGGDGNLDLAKKMKQDPTSALMSMGIDDPSLLRNANSILTNPQQVLQNLKNQLGNDNEDSKKDDSIETDEEEELPPAHI